MKSRPSLAVGPAEKCRECLVREPLFNKTEKHLQTGNVVLHSKLNSAPLEGRPPVHLGLHAGDYTDAGSPPGRHCEHPLSFLLLPLRWQDPLLVQRDQLGGDGFSEQACVKVGKEKRQDCRLPLQDCQMDQVDSNLTREVNCAAIASELRPIKGGNRLCYPPTVCGQIELIL